MQALSFIVVASILTCNNARADIDLERRNLAKIHHELGALSPFLDSAERSSGENTQQRFDHRKLKLLVKQIMIDIEMYLSESQRFGYAPENKKVITDNRKAPKANQRDEKPIDDSADRIDPSVIKDASVTENESSLDVQSR